jgi:hypothetical protein
MRGSQNLDDNPDGVDQTGQTGRMRGAGLNNITFVKTPNNG